jgi:HAD superfamily hydrolase (TIGR01509 family)
MFKAIIFDMDGVLIDSIGPIWESFSKVLKDEGVHFSDDYIKRNLARSLRDNLQAWKTEFGIKDYDLMEFSKKAGEIQFELMKKEKVNSELLALLQESKQNNIICGVATSSLRWRAEKILDLLDIKPFFQALVTADDIKNHKPAPDTFLEAAKKLNIKPEECVVIEDAGNGIDAAKNANMKTIALLTKYHSLDELKHADLVIKDFSELNIEKIKKLF